MNFMRIWVALSFVLFASTFVRAMVVPYATPSLGPLCVDFKLVVSGTPVPIYAFQREVNKPDYYFAHFSFSSPARVTVTGTSGANFNKATISPLAFNIPATLKANTLSFSINESRYLIVKIDSFRELVISADPLETQVPAASGPGIYNVATLGADSTGAQKSTSVFMNAIDTASKYPGGGTIYVPDGLYTVGNLVLQSNVTLYLSGGAVIQASRDPNDFALRYVIATPGSGKGQKPESGTWFISTAPHSSNIAIRGRGVIDGSGSYLTNHGYILDDLIVPLGTSHFTLDGIVGWDAGFWALIPTQSHDVSILNYKGMQSLTTFQNDGIDLNEDQNVVVRHTIIISRDDCYSTKTWGPKGLGTNWPDPPEPVMNALFRDVIAWTTDGAFKIGQGDYESHLHVTFDHGYVYSAHEAFYLKPNIPFTKAAEINSITFSNIDVETSVQRRPHFTWLTITLPNASMSNVTFRNIKVRSRGDAPSITTAPSGKITGFHLENVSVEGQKIKSLNDMNLNTAGLNLSEVSFQSTAPNAPQ